MQADEQVDALCMLLLCDAQDGRSTIMDGNDNSIQQIAAMMLLQMRADGDSGGNHWQPLATTGNPGKGGNPGKHVNWEIGLEEFPKKRTDTTNRTNSTNSAIRDKVIVVTVPHSACVSGKGAMGSEIGLNSNDMKQLELLQWRLDSALFAASPLNERACDRRAVVGAIALKMAFMRFLEETSPLIDDAGMIVLVSFISPFRSERCMARELVGTDEFVEVFVDTPIEICMQRDPKGLYVKARANEIKEFTGISAPYEPPVKPEIELHTDKLTIAESVALIMEYLKALDEEAEISI